MTYQQANTMLSKLQRLGISFTSLLFFASSVHAGTPSSYYERVVSNIQEFEQTGSLERLCYAFGENRRIISEQPNDPLANWYEAIIRYHSLSTDISGGSAFGESVTQYVEDCPYAQSFDQIVPTGGVVPLDDYHRRQIYFNLEQAAKGGIVHPAFFALYTHIYLEDGNYSAAVETAETGIRKAPQDSDSGNLADLYKQAGIANAELMHQAAQSMSSPQQPIVNLPFIGSIGGTLGRESVDDMTRYYRKAKDALEKSLELREDSSVRDFLYRLEQKAQALGIS